MMVSLENILREALKNYDAEFKMSKVDDLLEIKISQNCLIQ